MNGNGMEKGEKEEVAMVPKAGWGEKSGSWEDEGDADNEEGCGVASCKPGFLQMFSGMKTFTVLFGLASMYAGAMRAYLGTQLIWLERLYDISPRQASMVLSCMDIGFLVLVLFFSGLVKRWHMPRTLAVSTAVVGVAALLCVMPYAMHKSEMTPPPNVTEETQWTMARIESMAPTCTFNPVLSMEMMQILNAPTDENCKVIPPGGASAASTGQAGDSKSDAPAAQDPPSKDSPPAGTDVVEPRDAGPAYNASEGADQPAGENEQPSEGSDAGEDEAPPPPPGPTALVPDLTKLATHPLFPTLVTLAKAQYKIDLEALSKLSREEQQIGLSKLDESAMNDLPRLKAMLGEGGDEYFYPVALPAARRRRQAEWGDDQDTAAGNGTAAPTNAQAGVTEASEDGAAVETTKSPKSAKEMMLEKLQADPTWTGNTARMVQTSFAHLFADPCFPKKVEDFMASKCPYNTGPFLEDTKGSASALVALLSLGMVLAGIARAAHPAFMAVYVDSRTPETWTGLYLGILFGFAAFGAVVAQVLGGMASTSYISMEDVGLMSFLNPRWIGAWWVGLLIVGVASLILAVPLFLFPNPSPRTIPAGGKGASKIVKGFVQSLMRLLGNPVFLLITLGNAVTMMAAEGYLGYLPKYVHNEFSFSPMGEGLFLGMALALVIAVGVVIGGIIATFAKLSPFSCLKVAVGCAVGAFLFQAVTLGLGCDQPHVNMGDKMVNFTVTPQMTLPVKCSQTCSCFDLYMPVCGSDGQTYSSPCHAGCGHRLDGEWHHCQCIPDDVQTATFGPCPMECQGGVFYGYSFLVALVCFIVGIKLVPAFLATFRSVEKQDAAMAIGLNAFLVTLIGMVPSPMIYDALFQGICLQERSPCGPVDKCAIYDTEALNQRFNGLGAGLKALAAVLYVLAMLLGFRGESVFSRRVHEADRRK